jgi:hypothetical protein
MSHDDLVRIAGGAAFLLLGCLLIWRRTRR